MNICHIVFGLTTGGIETMLVNVANYQQEAGHNVTIIVINNLIDRQLISRINTKVNIHLINRPVGSKNPYYLFKLNWILLRLKPTVLHIHKANILPFIFPTFRPKVCVTQHELILNEDIKHIAKIEHRYSISQAVANDLRAKTQLDSIVIENGINLGMFEKSTSHYTPHETLKCVTVGRLEHTIKGQDTLIQACKILSNEGSVSYHLDIIGDGSSRQYLLDLIEKNNLSNNIDLVGSMSQSQLAKNLKQYDLFILPSNFEGFGISVIEAMAAGLPVLVSDLPALKQLTRDGEYGYIFTQGDSASCASVLSHIYNTGIKHNIYEKANEHVAAYDIHETVNKYLDQYEIQDINRQ